MESSDPQPFLPEIRRGKLRKCNAAVLSAGAAERDDKTALALGDVMRNQEGYQVEQLVPELLRLREAHNVILNFLFKPGLVLKLRNVERIRQAADIENKVSLLWGAVLEPERHAANDHSVRSLLEEQTRDLLLELPRAEHRGINYVVCIEAYLAEKLRFRVDSLADVSAGYLVERVLAAGLLVCLSPSIIFICDIHFSISTRQFPICALLLFASFIMLCHHVHRYGYERHLLHHTQRFYHHQSYRY